MGDRTRARVPQQTTETPTPSSSSSSTGTGMGNAAAVSGAGLMSTADMSSGEEYGYSSVEGSGGGYASGGGGAPVTPGRPPVVATSPDDSPERLNRDAMRLQELITRFSTPPGNRAGLEHIRDALGVGGEEVASVTVRGQGSYRVDQQAAEGLVTEAAHGITRLEEAIRSGNAASAVREASRLHGLVATAGTPPGNRALLLQIQTALAASVGGGTGTVNLGRHGSFTIDQASAEALDHEVELALATLDASARSARSATDGGHLLGVIGQMSTRPNGREQLTALQSQLNVLAGTDGGTVTVGAESFTLTREDLQVIDDAVSRAIRTVDRHGADAADAATPEAQRRAELARDLGRQRSMSGFASTVGSLIEAMVPHNGSEASLRLSATFPVTASGNGLVRIQFDIGAERDEDKVKVRGELGGGIIGRVAVPFVRAFVQARVFGFVEAESGSGAESMSFILLALRRRLASVSEDAANVLFDQNFATATEAGMTGEDYVESGLGGELSAGLEVGPRDEPAVSAGASVGGDHGTRIQRGAGGGVEATGVNTFRVGVRASIPHWGLEGQLELKWVNGRFKEGEVELTGESEINLHHVAAYIGPEMLGGMLGNLGNMVRGGARLNAADAPAGRQFGSIADVIVGIPPGRLAAAAALEHLREAHPGMPEMEVAYALTAKVKWEDSGKIDVALRLARQSQLTVSAAGADTEVHHNDVEVGVSAELQTLTPVFHQHWEAHGPAVEGGGAPATPARAAT